LFFVLVDLFAPKVIFRPFATNVKVFAAKTVKTLYCVDDLFGDIRRPPCAGAPETQLTLFCRYEKCTRRDCCKHSPVHEFTVFRPAEPSKSSPVTPYQILWYSWFDDIASYRSTCSLYCISCSVLALTLSDAAKVLADGLVKVPGMLADVFTANRRNKVSRS